MSDDKRQNLREWLMALNEQHGHLTPHLVREAARPEDSPAHKFVFGLAPDEAAEAHYLDRAHRLIQTVRITTVATEQEAPRRIRAFTFLPSQDAYFPTTDVAKDVDKFLEAQIDALARLHAARTALEDLRAIATAEAQRGAISEAVGHVGAAEAALTPS